MADQLSMTAALLTLERLVGDGGSSAGGRAAVGDHLELGRAHEGHAGAVAGRLAFAAPKQDLVCMAGTQLRPGASRMDQAESIRDEPAETKNITHKDRRWISCRKVGAVRVP